MRALPLLLALLLAGCDALGGDGIEIVRYVGEPITEARAAVEIFPFPPEGWRGIREGDVLLLRRSVTCGDECGETTALRFEGMGALPTDAAGTVTVTEFTPDRTELTALDIERVEIQDWGPDVFSGQLILASDPDALDLDAPIVFWADLSYVYPD